MSSFRHAELDILVTEAAVECYPEHDLAMPFETDVGGVPVVVRTADLRSSGIAANCQRDWRSESWIGRGRAHGPDCAQWIDADQWAAGS